MLPEYVYVSAFAAVAIAGGVWVLHTDREALRRAVARQKRKIQEGRAEDGPPATDHRGGG